MTDCIHNDRNCKKGNEHHEALEEVSPAYCLVAAKECIDEDQHCEDDHGKMLMFCKPGKNRSEYCRACNECGSNINSKADKEDDRAYDLQYRTLACESVCEILRERYRVT